MSLNVINPSSPHTPTPSRTTASSEQPKRSTSQSNTSRAEQSAAPQRKPSAPASAEPVAAPAAPRAEHAAELNVLRGHENAATAINTIASGAGRDELEISVRTTRAAGNDVGPASLGPASGTHLSTAALTLGTQSTNVTPDRLGVMFNQANLGGNHGVTGHIGTTLGLLFGSLNQHAGSTTITEYAGGIGQTRVIGGSVAKQIGNVGVLGGASLVASGDSRLRVRTYHDNKYQIEYKDTIQVAGQMVGGVSSGHLGLGIRIGASKVRSIVYRTWVSPKEAEQLTNRRSWFRERLSALRIRKPLLALPRITDPQNAQDSGKNVGKMKVGDEMYITYTGSVVGGIAVSGGGVYLGAHVSMSGTHQLTVIKTSEHEIQLTVMPGQKSQVVGIGLDLPAAAEAHVTTGRSRASRHVYLFDLRKPEALSSYLKAVDGELPGPLYEVERYAVLGAPQAQQAVADVTMPAGVTYELLEQAATPVERTMGTNITLPRLIPFANLAGIGTEQRYSTEQSVIATRDVAVHQNGVRREREIQKLHQGSSEMASYGSVQTLHRSDETAPTLGGVTVGVSFSTDRTQRKNRNQILKHLQSKGLVDKSLPRFSEEAVNSKYEYQVTLERVISNKTLEQLTPEGESPTQQATQIQTDVATRGAAGLAELANRLRSSTNQLRVSVNSAGPTALLEKVVDLSATYQRPIEPRFTKSSAIATRIKDVSKYLNRIDELRRDISADPLLEQLDPKSKQAQLESLDASEAALKRLVRLDHLGSNTKAYFISQSSTTVKKILNEWKKKGML